MSILNQYSFVFITLGGALVLALGMWRLRRPTRMPIRAAVLCVYTLLTILVLVGSQFPTSNTLTNSYIQVEQTIHNGTPTFVMLYSHFCAGCIAALPAARNLDEQLREHGQQIDLLFLDIHSSTGRAAREQLHYRFTPTYLLYDAKGVELLRQTSIPALEDIVLLLAPTLE